ncbi:MAG: hypothetical protein NZ602_10820 [Thermoguttaceae bacterium]|nr:hypothetical protein [Thermoguttaceae bacterium]MDW8038543.1 hypothetical protein [Thermoguttaceae bacterium]
MRLSPPAWEVREIVEHTFQLLGLSEGELEELTETILLQEGRYLARSYRAGNLMAMWLVEVGILQFYDDQGRMLRTINLLLEKKPARAAA